MSFWWLFHPAVSFMVFGVVIILVLVLGALCECGFFTAFLGAFWGVLALVTGCIAQRPLEALQWAWTAFLTVLKRFLVTLLRRRGRAIPRQPRRPSSRRPLRRRTRRFRRSR